MKLKMKLSSQQNVGRSMSVGKQIMNKGSVLVIASPLCN